MKLETSKKESLWKKALAMITPGRFLYEIFRPYEKRVLAETMDVKGFHDLTKSGKRKVGFNIAYSGILATSLLVGGAFYHARVSDTGSWNWNEQSRIFDERKEILKGLEGIGKEYRHTTSKGALRNLVDSNHDGEIKGKELLDFYKITGIDSSAVDQNFPVYNLDDSTVTRCLKAYGNLPQ